MQRMRANGKKIVDLRDKLDMTQEELSARVGYSVKTIWKAESGGVLRRRTLEHIAIALNTSLDDVSAGVVC
jgi:transcriptional regulator with XRE-family HTH domain